MPELDVAIIGGGFYGCVLALHLRQRFERIAILERESDLLLKASYNNQARVHNGYHYPRSFITASRSHANYRRFAQDFPQAINDTFTMVYAIARNNSKVTPLQFVKFCHQIGSPVRPAPPSLASLFNDILIDGVFLVDEVVFNAATLRHILKSRLEAQGVQTRLQSEVLRISGAERGLDITLRSGDIISSARVFNCAYAHINQILTASDLPTVSLKHELAEMPLLHVPKELDGLGLTIMDGPFFAVMPFPDKGLHTIHHVRYTPVDTSTRGVENLASKASKCVYMLKDAQRYVPLLAKAQHAGSLWEIKTVLLQHETTDARPILLKTHHGLRNFHVVLGGKIDNIYDVLETLDASSGSVLETT